MRHASLKSSQEWACAATSRSRMTCLVINHPLRPIRTLVDEVLRDLSPRFARLYATTGRPSIPPEQLLRALLLQPLASRSNYWMTPSLRRNESRRFITRIVRPAAAALLFAIPTAIPMSSMSNRDVGLRPWSSFRVNASQ
jgi:hypothetical protein